MIDCKECIFWTSGKMPSESEKIGSCLLEEIYLYKQSGEITSFPMAILMARRMPGTKTCNAGMKGVYPVLTNLLDEQFKGVTNE